jgi:hypothetical protein
MIERVESTGEEADQSPKEQEGESSSCTGAEAAIAAGGEVVGGLEEEVEFLTICSEVK